jgi:hypothetical protein
LPWLLHIGAGKSAAAAIKITLSGWPRKSVLLTLFLLVPAGLLAALPGAIRQRLRDDRRLFLFLAMCVGGLAGAFLLLLIPTSSEYKILMLAQIPISLVLALAVRDWIETRPLPAVALIAALMWPSAYKFAPPLLFGIKVADPAQTNGIAVVPDRPSDRDLHVWISTNTPRDSRFIDTFLTVPVFAQRALLVGLDARRQQGSLGGARDGWDLPARDIIEQVNGADPVSIARLAAAASALLDAEALPDAEALAVLERGAREKPVYVVARKEALRKKLRDMSVLELTYENSSGAVFRLSTAAPPSVPSDTAADHSNPTPAGPR